MNTHTPEISAIYRTEDTSNDKYPTYYSNGTNVNVGFKVKCSGKPEISCRSRMLDYSKQLKYGMKNLKEKTNENNFIKVRSQVSIPKIKPTFENIMSLGTNEMPSVHDNSLPVILKQKQLTRHIVKEELDVEVKNDFDPALFEIKSRWIDTIDGYGRIIDRLHCHHPNTYLAPIQTRSPSVGYLRLIKSMKERLI